jgi:hypothetical protein
MAPQWLRSLCTKRSGLRRRYGLGTRWRLRSPAPCSVDAAGLSALDLCLSEVRVEMLHDRWTHLLNLSPRCVNLCFEPGTRRPPMRPTAARFTARSRPGRVASGPSSTRAAIISGRGTAARLSILRGLFEGGDSLQIAVGKLVPASPSRPYSRRPIANGW